MTIMTPRSRGLRSAMTLLELLTVLSVIAALLAIAVPAYQATREDANVATCLNNLQQIAHTAAMYCGEYGSVAEACQLALPWYLANVPKTCNYNCYSEFVYGGFQARVENELLPQCAKGDVYCIADEYRPFNKYIAPGICGSAIIKQYICPSDKFNSMPMFGTQTPPMIDERHSSWEVNGNSYAINWYWPNYFESGGPYQGQLIPAGVVGCLTCMTQGGSAMLQKKAGGAAAEFVIFMEGAMNTYMDGARPPDWPVQSFPLQGEGMGWHGKPSWYCMAMWDGHVEYRYVDTRYASGQGYTIFPSNDTSWPPGCPSCCDSGSCP